MKSKKFLTGVTLFFFLVLTAGSANALTLSYSDAFSNILTELAGEELRVSKFDSALGTLDSVVVTMSGNLQSSGTIENNAANEETFTVSTLVQMYDGITSALAPSYLADPFSLFAPFTTIGTETYTMAPGSSASFGPAMTTSGPLTLFDSSVDAGALAEFEGMGEFGYDLTTIILTTIRGGGGNVATAIETTAGAELTVTYNYTAPIVPPDPVPEPMTMTLLGLGLIGFAYSRRRQLGK